MKLCLKWSPKQTMLVDVIQEEDNLKARSVEFTLVPDAWKAFGGDLLPCSWQMTKLDQSGRNHPCLGDRAGIYTLLVVPGIATHPACAYLMYVGQTHNLGDRFGNYLVTEKKTRKRPNVFRLLNIYEGYIWFCFTEVEADRLDEYENALMDAYMPPVNAKNRMPAGIRSTIGAF